MRRQVRRAFAIQETRTVIDVEGRPQARRQIQVQPGAHRVALIVIESANGIPAGSVADQSTRDSAIPLRMLVRVRKVPGSEPSEARRRRRSFPPADASPLQREWEEDVGVA